MSKQNTTFNSILIVLVVGTIGCVLIVWPLHGFLAAVTDKIKAGHNWLPIVVGISYIMGFFATRIVQDGFEAIFGKAPFSDIGQAQGPGGEKKHPSWVDSMLNPLGYFLFLVRVTVSVAVVSAVVWLIIWLGSGGAR
jgi:hypothetical protein